MLDITEGLEKLHKMNIIYQNFSLKNIQRVGFEDRYKLRFNRLREINNFNAYKTKDYYMAPEQYNEEEFNFSADIWSLAIIFI